MDMATHGFSWFLFSLYHLGSQDGTFHIQGESCFLGETSPETFS